MSDPSGYPGSDCGIVVELLGSYDDGDLNEAAQVHVQQHLDSCEACSERLAALRAFNETAVAEPAQAALSAGGPGRHGAGWDDRTRGWERKAIPILLAGGVVASGGVVGARLLTRDGAAPVVASADLSRPGGQRGVPLPDRPRLAEGSADLVASLTEVGDDEARSYGFSLERAVDLRVQAIGEGMNNEMYDLAWIIDASSRRPVWTMRYSDTHPAGGAQKNRMVDEVISLDPGNYILYYGTDGSHSFDSWNAAPPPAPERWGVTVWTTRARDRSAVEPYDPRTDPSILAQIVGVRDNQHRSRTFALDDETQLRVYAIGEGMANEMYDYAWIEDAQARRAVWRMQYNQTEPAGGADKNRLVHGTLRLPAGSYVLHYVTDDSHSFDDWNAQAPDDPMGYGVTLYRAGG